MFANESINLILGKYGKLPGDINPELLAKAKGKAVAIEDNDLEEEEIVVIEPTPSTGVNPYKQLTRLSSDRNGQRAGFSSSVGRVVDEMQANTPERKKKRPRTTVEQVNDVVFPTKPSK